MVAQQQGAAQIAKKIVVFTLVGFLVVTLSGPALAVLGALLPFAFVGFLCWLVYKAILLGPTMAFRGVSKTVSSIVRGILFVPRAVLGGIWSGTKWVGRNVGRGVLVAGSLILAAAAGAAVGAILGYIGGMQFQDVEYRVPAGAAIGAVIGVLALLVRDRPARASRLLPMPQPAVPAGVLNLETK